jgi:hypothetical protein
VSHRSGCSGIDRPRAHEARSRGGILRRSPALQAHIAASKGEAEGRIQFAVDGARVARVVLKLTRGHAFFELSQPCRDDPTKLMWSPIAALTPDEREEFEAPHIPQVYGEVGSRGMQRLIVTQFTLRSATGGETRGGFLALDWINVQEERYRYIAVHDVDHVRVRLVIGEYLACDVMWET